MYLSRIASVALAAALQIVPLCRVALSNQLLAPSSFAVIFRLLAGTTVALGGYHTVSGASTVINSPKTAKGTNGVPFSYRITTGPDVANQYKATPLPTGLSCAFTTGRITGTPTASGVFTVQLWASDNGTASRTVTANLTLTIVDGTPGTAPTIASQPQPVTVNSGLNASFSVTANGTAPLSYAWQRNSVNVSGGTNATLNLTAVNTAKAGNYRVIVSNPWGSVTSSVVALTVVLPPSITQQPAPVTANLGQAATFSVVATGTAPLSYSWALGGVPIPGANSATFTLPAVSGGDAGAYTVTVSNGAGSVTSSVATLAVVLPPSITQQPAAATVNLGQLASFAVVASGTAPLSYSWAFNGVPIPGASSATFSLPAATAGDAGAYTVTISNGAGSVTSGAAALTVVLPPTITTQPLAQTVTAGDTLTLTAAATGSDPLAYQWFLGTALVPGATGSSLVIPNITTAAAGDYHVDVSNGAGTVSSAVARVTVQELIKADLLLSAGAIGSDGQFSLQVTGPVNSTYVIWTSLDLNAWTAVSTNVVTDGVLSFKDPVGPSDVRRFYRATLSP